ncbi:uncharacterized protein LOC110450680 isoform X2 [Mizuhopecten yessoensis]|uniref:Uncharacterized protein n=1 Tax=Mizuhopecten yessoensis TaxID=6573 RepID=A0A210R7E2_MIZYE|nr:uncharacterized protein LOC110450680 isoform X1 [Mizuhopecten yessoensis]XP_021354107.1 uncharacterized protein LOC110450680 isoform X2 [Mizuhopecten yessoensis]OWF56844.1 hypothetical protein KP79_PYT10083 [Mizuhopecten yessoensis]
MGVGSNTTTVVPGVTPADLGVVHPCNYSYLCTEESSFLGADLLQFAPCPPPWKKDLLWEVAKQKGLADDETEQIASRCVIPLPQAPGQCGSSCIAISVISGCILLTICFAILCWCRRRGMVRKSPRSTNQNNTDHVQATVQTRKADPVYEEFQEGRVHYSNIMESAYDNPAYTSDLTTDHARSNSDTSNNSHTQLNGTAANQNNNKANINEDVRL